MEVVAASESTTVDTSVEERLDLSGGGTAARAADLEFDLGLWLSGLESFLGSGNHSFVDPDRPRAARDWTKEFRLTHSTLLLCAKLNFRLMKRSTAQGPDGDRPTLPVSAAELQDLSVVLRDSIMVSDALVRAEPLHVGEWKSWCVFLRERLRSVSAFNKLIQGSEAAGERYLPEKLLNMLHENKVSFSDASDLQRIAPRFARVLRYLNIVGRMLKNDEPLKPTLIIFSRVHELTHELVNHINNRLSRFPDEDAELFRSLDSASYTASIELRKVFDQELSGLVGIRPALSIYARVETAYALLNDSFQQILSGFARLIDPQITSDALFPNFQEKLQRSLMLRKDLSEVIRSVHAAEFSPEGKPLNAMNLRLGEFLREPVHYLFYKDKETVERFVEEIFVTKDKKDLVPILHRFAAYLETLFGQINNRAVLAGHPFEDPRG